MPNVPLTNFNVLAASTTPGNTILSGPIDATIQDLIQTINDNYALFLALRDAAILPIPDQSVITAHLRNLAVTNAKLAPLAVTADKIADGTITTAKLADLLITAVKIAENAVTNPKIATDAVDARVIAPGAVGVTELSSSLLANYGDIATNAKFDDIKISIKNFGAVADYNTTTLIGTDNTTAFLNAIAAVNASGSTLFIPAGKYYIASDIYFPKFVDCQGEIYGGKVIFRQMKEPVIKNLFCENVLFTGVWRGDISIRSAKNVTVDGNTDSWGSTWNNFSIQRCDQIIIDITEGYVTQNRFTGGRPNFIHITGTDTKYPASAVAHNNWFESMDLSSGGALQDDSKMQTNYLVNTYSEGTESVIVGNWQILGNISDRIPTVPLDSHILFMNNGNPLSGQDFMSLSTSNMVEGGEWDSLDGSGRPKGVSYTSATAAVVADATAPDGSGKAVKVDTSSAFGCFVLNLTGSISTSGGGITFFAKGTINSVVLSNAASTAYYNAFTSVDVGNDWKLYRVSVPKAYNITKATVYLTTSTAATVTAYYAGIKATPFKATPLPFYNPGMYCRGSLSAAPTAGIWRKGDFVSNSDISVSGAIAGWLCTNPSPLTFKPMMLGDQLFSQRRYWTKTVSTSNKIIATFGSRSFACGVTIELTVRINNSQGSPDFTGYVSILKYLIVLSKENTTIRQTATQIGAAKSDFGTVASGSPVVSVTDSGSSWEINIDIASGQGDSVCYCQMEYSIMSGSTTVTLLEA